MNSMNLMNMSPLLHFIFYEASSLVERKAVWDTMKVGKTFCKSIDGSFDRIVGREGKSILSIWLRIKYFPCHNENGPG